jgi:hypothetical protein
MKSVVLDWMFFEVKNREVESSFQLAEKAIVHFELYGAVDNDSHWIWQLAEKALEQVYDTPL